MTNLLIAAIILCLLLQAFYLGRVLERRRQRRLGLDRIKARADHYSPRPCTECAHLTVYPACCDTCGASHPFHLPHPMQDIEKPH